MSDKKKQSNPGGILGPAEKRSRLAQLSMPANKQPPKPEDTGEVDIAVPEPVATPAAEHYNPKYGMMPRREAREEMISRETAEMHKLKQLGSENLTPEQSARLKQLMANYISDWDGWEAAQPVPVY